ncbi:LamG-like jellyroll fold domain-containing protein [Microbacterium sp. NPDC019599]|uniref:LamG domain-containing protein n=1 Tax=Microbacterium sp. NPDC019599 TaxID=3154690 RepID=UPI0033C70F33
MNSASLPSPHQFTRRQALLAGARSALAAGAVLVGVPSYAHAAPGARPGTRHPWALAAEPASVPAPIARWDFAASTAPFAASTPGIAALVQGPGSSAVKVSTPFGGGVRFNGTTDYLRIPAAQVGGLNVGASTNAVTVAAWVYSTDTNTALIAGCWHETSAGGGRRSYALFNDLPTYGGDDRVCLHVSRTGGITPGYPHSIHYAADGRGLARGVWQLHVGTYDGARAIAYLNGTATSFASFTDKTGASYSKNPYVFGDGINPTAGDFLVGASLRDGSAINFHRGEIARLRVWNRALTAAEVWELYDSERAALEMPTPVASWSFSEAAPPYASSVPGSPSLRQGPGSTSRRVSTPFGGGVEFNGSNDYLRIPENEIGRLNVGATTNAVTVAAWVYSTDADRANIAGCWQESRSDPCRSYALFNDLPVYGGDDMVCMEVSKLGDATPGYPYSIDYAAEPRRLTRGVWQFYTGTYDGSQAIAYLNGAWTSYPTYTDNQGATYAKNPYQYPDGLNATPVEFIVGAVIRDSQIINQHKGRIAGLRVWDVALTPAQIRSLYEGERVALG